MKKKAKKERAIAVQRFLQGENPQAICASVSKSTRWLYKWVARYTPEDPAWCEDRSRKPLISPHRTPAEIEDIVAMVRFELVQQGGLLRCPGYPLGIRRSGGTTLPLNPQH